MKYTTPEKIARKLRARLSLMDATNNPLVYPTTNITVGVDNEQIELIAEEKENFVDYILDQIYETPLTNNHPILADIIEGLTIADLIKISFQAQPIPSDSFGTEMKTEAYLKLNMLVSGFNIQIPGLPQVQSYPGMIPARRIVLKGETIRDRSPEQVIINNQFFLNNRTSQTDTFGFLTEN